jgi:hypothetical protein
MHLGHFGLFLYPALFGGSQRNGWLLLELVVEDAERFSADMIRRSS